MWIFEWPLGWFRSSAAPIVFQKSGIVRKTYSEKPVTKTTVGKRPVTKTTMSRI